MASRGDGWTAERDVVGVVVCVVVGPAKVLKSDETVRRQSNVGCFEAREGSEN